MRTPRIAILVLFLTACLFLLCRAVFSTAQAVSSVYPTRGASDNNKSVWGFMYYNTPFSLFPPNAAISLTDDNSTSFAARPAAFGPKLAVKGLSGQLWVGSDFAEDSAGGGSELGCSDLLGWGNSKARATLENVPRAAAPQVTTPGGAASSRLESSGQPLAQDNRAENVETRGNDNEPSTANLVKTTSHDNPILSPLAEILSTQQSVEIKGKVVLLKRGGCGFLEKVMWAQRRGAIGVIVGDNQRGGPLIQMFAHGDEVDNVTIPSVFTARTTAQLLSSLTRPGSFMESTVDDNGNPILKVQQSVKASTSRKASSSSLRPAASLKNNKLSSKKLSSKPNSVIKAKTSKSPAYKVRGLLTRFFPSTGLSRKTVNHEQLDWVLVEDNDESPVKATEKHNSFESNPDLSDDESRNKMNPYEGLDADVPENLPPPTMPGEGVHEGLWVTITPTSGASPFFDTLLVLVISPLVTLAVVYAMLIIRARVRRRRWRAPKSVVERLPVRTYHTVPPSPGPSPRVSRPSTPTPTPTPSTPLLQQIPPRTRTRPSTAAADASEHLGVVDASSGLPSTPATAPRAGRRKYEKGLSAEWKKYMGRQSECVVCLEEYVDGVSQVMSLPCGHEFHVDCITPWLTTRRRTCPICKGDVVRSLARGSSSTPRYEPYQDSDDDDDDVDDEDDEPEAESSRNRSPDVDTDLEQGVHSPEPRRTRGRDGWFGFLNNFTMGTETDSRHRAISRPSSRASGDRSR